MAVCCGVDAVTFAQRAKRSGTVRSFSELFRAFDTDDSGAVSNKEFRSGLESMGEGVTAREAAAVFKRFDRSGDGSISRREFEEFCEGMRPADVEDSAHMPYEGDDFEETEVYTRRRYGDMQDRLSGASHQPGEVTRFIFPAWHALLWLVAIARQLLRGFMWTYNVAVSSPWRIFRFCGWLCRRRTH